MKLGMQNKYRCHNILRANLGIHHHRSEGARGKSTLLEVDEAGEARSASSSSLSAVLLGAKFIVVVFVRSWQTTTTLMKNQEDRMLGMLKFPYPTSNPIPLRLLLGAGTARFAGEKILFNTKVSRTKQEIDMRQRNV
jgi:hypothetical protein